MTRCPVSTGTWDTQNTCTSMSSLDTERRLIKDPLEAGFSPQKIRVPAYNIWGQQLFNVHQNAVNVYFGNEFLKVFLVTMDWYQTTDVKLKYSALQTHSDTPEVVKNLRGFLGEVGWCTYMTMPAGDMKLFLKQPRVDGYLPSFGFGYGPCKRLGSALEDPKPTGGLLLLKTQLISVRLPLLKMSRNPVE